MPLLAVTIRPRIDLYQTAMNSGELNDVEYFGGSEELIAYSGFRTALGYLQVGDIAMASNAIERTIAGYPDSLHGRAAVEFQNATGLTAAGTSGSIALAYGSPNKARYVCKKLLSPMPMAF